MLGPTSPESNSKYGCEKYRFPVCCPNNKLAVGHTCPTILTERNRTLLGHKVTNNIFYWVKNSQNQRKFRV